MCPERGTRPYCDTLDVSQTHPLPEITRLRTADGVVLTGRHDPVRPDPADPETGQDRQARVDGRSGEAVPTDDGLAFVVVHGFTGSWRRPDLRAVVERLRRHGGVVSFDLRGHGTSTGLATVGASEHPDVSAAVAWARALGYRRVVTVGFSLGSLLVVRQAALDRGVDAVVAVSGPSRWNYRGTPPMRRLHLGMGTRLGRAVLARRFGTRVAAGGWDPLPLPPDATVALVAPTPLLLVHGDADPYFPVEHALWLAEGAGPAATLWIEPGMGHAEAASSPELLDRMARWARAVAAERVPSARMRA